MPLQTFHFDRGEIAPAPAKALGGQCTCGLAKTCKSPLMKPFGKGDLGIVVVAEAPGEVEDEQGIPLIGPAGRYLRSRMEWARIDLDGDCVRTNAIQCRPPGNRDPTAAELASCSGRLDKQIREVAPNLILALGRVAIGACLPDAPFTPTATLMHGRIVPSPRWNCWVACGLHPSWYLHESGRGGGQDILMDRLLERTIKQLDIPFKDQRLDESKFTILEDPYEVESLITRLRMSKTPVAVDFETTRLSPWMAGAKLLSVGVADSTDEGWCIPMEHVGAAWSGDGLARARVAVARFLASPVPKVIQNWAGMEEPWSVIHLGTPIRNVVCDTMVREHVIDNRQGVCSQEFQTYVRYGTTYKSEVNKSALDRTPLPAVARYNVLDCRYLLKWVADQEAELDDDLRRAYGLFHEALPVMAACKYRGIQLDIKVLDDLSTEVKTEQDKEHKVMESGLLKQYHQKYRERWEPGSNQRQQRLFYGLLELKPLKLTPKGKDPTNPLDCSTDKESLEHLLTQVELGSDSELLIKMCLRGSRLTKIGGYLDNFREMADKENRVHPTFNLHTVDSYRSSSSDPNFQNIPARDPEMARLRRAFVSSLDWLVEADYSGAEVCGYAHITRDPRLIRYILDGVDFHRRYAALLYEKNEADVTGEERFHGKNGFVFPKLYKSQAEGIAKSNPQWDRRAVQDTYDEFEREFAGVTRWQKENFDFYQQYSYVQLLTGFRCRWGKHGPLIPTQTSNMPCQGFAFHRLLRACVDVEAEMRAAGMRSQIIGQIHDSMVLDAADDELELLITLLQRNMCRPGFGFDDVVPWKAEFKVGKNLLDMDKV